MERRFEYLTEKVTDAHLMSHLTERSEDGWRLHSASCWRGETEYKGDYILLIWERPVQALINA